QRNHHAHGKQAQQRYRDEHFHERKAGLGLNPAHYGATTSPGLRIFDRNPSSLKLRRSVPACHQISSSTRSRISAPGPALGGISNGVILACQPPSLPPSRTGSNSPPITVPFGNVKLSSRSSILERASSAARS